MSPKKLSKKKKQSPYVKSRYPRRKNDHYPTIDHRCTLALVESVRMTGPIVDVCAPSGSGIVDALTKLGKDAFGIGDAFTDKIVSAKWIAFNPPYKPITLVESILRAQINRVMNGEVFGVAALMRTAFDHVSGTHRCLTIRFIMVK
jgi:hypothetical protein